MPTAASSWFIFYGQLESPGKAVLHLGDSLDGEGDGDDEIISVTLGMLPPQAARVVFAVSIHEADQRGQNFGQVANSFIRLVDTVSGQEIARYDLEEDSSVYSAVVFGELQRVGTDWNFVAVNQAFPGGLAGLVTAFGLSVS